MGDLDMLLQVCKNLERIVLQGHLITNRVLHSLRDYNHSIKTVEIYQTSISLLSNLESLDKLVVTKSLLNQECLKDIGRHRRVTLSHLELSHSLLDKSQEECEMEECSITQTDFYYPLLKQIIPTFANLQKLCLDYTNVNDELLLLFVQYCKKLVQISVAYCPLVGDLGILALSLLPLKKVNLSGCDYITPRGVQGLCRYSNNLEMIAIHNCEGILGSFVMDFYKGERVLGLECVLVGEAIKDLGLYGFMDPDTFADHRFDLDEESESSDDIKDTRPYSMPLHDSTFVKKLKDISETDANSRFTPGPSRSKTTSMISMPSSQRISKAKSMAVMTPPPARLKAMSMIIGTPTPTKSKTTNSAVTSSSSSSTPKSNFTKPTLSSMSKTTNAGTPTPTRSKTTSVVPSTKAPLRPKTISAPSATSSSTKSTSVTAPLKRSSTISSSTNGLSTPTRSKTVSSTNSTAKSITTNAMSTPTRSKTISSVSVVTPKPKNLTSKPLTKTTLASTTKETRPSTSRTLPRKSTSSMVTDTPTRSRSSSVSSTSSTTKTNDTPTRSRTTSTTSTTLTPSGTPTRTLNRTTSTSTISSKRTSFASDTSEPVRLNTPSRSRTASVCSTSTNTSSTPTRTLNRTTSTSTISSRRTSVDSSVETTPSRIPTLKRK